MNPTGALIDDGSSFTVDGIAFEFDKDNTFKTMSSDLSMKFKYTFRF